MTVRVRLVASLVFFTGLCSAQAMEPSMSETWSSRYMEGSVDGPLPGLRDSRSHWARQWHDPALDDPEIRFGFGLEDEREADVVEMEQWFGKGQAEVWQDSRKGRPADGLVPLLEFGPDGVQQWKDEAVFSAAEVEGFLAEDQPEVWRDLQEGRPAVVDLGSWMEVSDVPPKILSRGIESYALYDDAGNFVQWVFVPWDVDVKDLLSEVTQGLKEGWQVVRVMFKVGGEFILSLEEKMDEALARAKKWACNADSRPESVSVTVGADLDLLNASFGASAEATYSVEDLCDGG